MALIRDSAWMQTVTREHLQSETIRLKTKDTGFFESKIASDSSPIQLAQESSSPEVNQTTATPTAQETQEAAPSDDIALPEFTVGSETDETSQAAEQTEGLTLEEKLVADSDASSALRPLNTVHTIAAQENIVRAVTKLTEVSNYSDALTINNPNSNPNRPDFLGGELPPGFLSITPANLNQILSGFDLGRLNQAQNAQGFGQGRGFESVSDKIFGHFIVTPPPFDTGSAVLTLSINNVNENAAKFTIIGALSVIDGGAAPYTFALINNAGGRFAISGSNLIVNNGAFLNYENATSHSITVRAVGQGAFLLDQTFSITINDVNEAPIGANDVVTLNEDVTYTFSASDFTFTDPDSDAFSGIRINSVETAGVLQHNGIDVVADQFITASELASGLLTFAPVANANGSAYATFTYVLSDGSLESASTYTMTLNVTAINDAPVLTPSTPALTTITENDTNNSGDTVAALLGASVSDIDSASQGIAIYLTSVTSGEGTWQYKVFGGGNWTDIGVVSSGSALLLRSTDSIRFVPNGLLAATAAIAYYAWDQSIGSAGTKVDVSTRGGSTAFSLLNDQANITVTEVADTYVLTSGNDVVIGGSLNDTVQTTVLNYNIGDSIDGGGGNDTLQLTGGGVFTLSNNLTSIESVALTSGSYTLDLGTSGINTVDASALTPGQGLTFDGSALNYAVTITGGPGVDSIIGTAQDDVISGGGGADILQGGAGNDYLDGGAGADLLIGGLGNDVLVYDLGDLSVINAASGESGTDTLQVTGSGTNIDFTTIDDTYVTGIERVDLTGSGNNSATLNLTDVLAISDTVDYLYIEGDAGDSVTLTGGGWSASGLNNGPEGMAGQSYTLYTNALGEVYVDTDVTVILS